ncbi:MAG: COX15/CtaA family protein [Bacteriovoracaceae bacterium]|jgi:cytochrome c oxidase assembly protein subunit 15|nr:COX15/CtaA family protein [Bacteriovoracaceae bacterium]
MKYDKAVVTWLYLVCFLVFSMVFIGGITRLTDSGLSMVDWKPLMGAIPPLNEVQWNTVFDKYKQFPEYNQVNYSMTLSQFKFIFFWEYFHRLMGRLVGVVFFFPFVYFWFKGKINGHKGKLFVAFLLGGSQGLLGWYMVKSGLVDRPDVSHFRLAAHLFLAFIIIGFIFWITFEMKLKHILKPVLNKKLLKILSVFFFLLCFQIIYGAFVAGLDAGIGFNTWPLMAGSFISKSAYSAGSLWVNIFYNPVMIQFIHRTIAILLLIIGFLLYFNVRGLENSVQKKSIIYCLVILFLQFVLGVSTLVLEVPIWAASIHQVVACILFVLTLRSIYIFSRKSVI